LDLHLLHFRSGWRLPRLLTLRLLPGSLLTRRLLTRLLLTRLLHTGLLGARLLRPRLPRLLLHSRLTRLLPGLPGLLLLHAGLLLARLRGLRLPWLSLGAWLLIRRLRRLLRVCSGRSQQRDCQKLLLHSELLSDVGKSTKAPP